MQDRRKSKKIKIGKIFIGGDSPISVQSMLNAKSNDLKENIRQGRELEKAGCEILRVSVPDTESVNLIYALKENVNIPIVADIHFNHKLAVNAANAGVDKIRINPGNIGSDKAIEEVADICNQKNIPIRIGVNSGSVEKKFLSEYGGATPEALCESALYNVSLLEKFDFKNIIISAKSSNVKDTVSAYRMIAKACNYPLHLGITETGVEKIGLLKSAAGIGSLLLDGIGDTIRISLTANPIKEVEAGINLLKALRLRKGIDIISCPTCGRTRINVENLTNEAQRRLRGCSKNLKVAIMGCVVNGPGEASYADIGICGGNGVGVLFKKGKKVKCVPEEEILDNLITEINKMETGEEGIDKMQGA